MKKDEKIYIDQIQDPNLFSSFKILCPLNESCISQDLNHFVTVSNE